MASVLGNMPRYEMEQRLYDLLNSQITPDANLETILGVRQSYSDLGRIQDEQEARQKAAYEAARNDDMLRLRNELMSRFTGVPYDHNTSVSPHMRLSPSKRAGVDVSWPEGMPEGMGGGGLSSLMAGGGIPPEMDSLNRFKAMAGMPGYPASLPMPERPQPQAKTEAPAVQPQRQNLEDLSGLATALEAAGGDASAIWKKIETETKAEDLRAVPQYIGQIRQSLMAGDTTQADELFSSAMSGMSTKEGADALTKAYELLYKQAGQATSQKQAKKKTKIEKSRVSATMRSQDIQGLLGMLKEAKGDEREAIIMQLRQMLGVRP